jgi:hypothetical protein
MRNRSVTLDSTTFRKEASKELISERRHCVSVDRSNVDLHFVLTIWEEEPKRAHGETQDWRYSILIEEARDV